MKTKLLKKVRKRFSIQYYPYGGVFYGTVCDEPCMGLVENDGSVHHLIRLTTQIINRSDAYTVLYEKLVSIIRANYRRYGTRRNSKMISVKLWYK